MKCLRSQRGSSLLVATLAMLALIAASTGAMVAVVVAHAQRVSHQNRGVQALYLAEMGCEEMLALRAAGEDTTSIRRTVPQVAEGEPAAAGPSEARAATSLGDGGDAASVVGSYEVTAERMGARLEVCSRGIVPTPAGRFVVREVRIVCRRQGDRLVPERWEQVP